MKGQATMEDTDLNKYKKYIEEAIQYTNDVSPFEHCFDSQTQWVIHKIKENIKKDIKIIDYGCGQLRLLNALNKEGLLSEINYFATDIKSPDMTNLENLPFVFKTIQETKQMTNSSIDVAVLMNVIHEISILDIVEIIETIRRLLSPDGKIFLVDIAVLPKGEYRALPFYPWELTSLFRNSNDFSYISKGGIPIVALEIPHSTIPVYTEMAYNLCELIVEKRDLYASLACMLPSRSSNRKINNWLKKMSLEFGDGYILSYLMLLSGFANFRFIEYSSIPDPSYTEICDAAEAILRWYFKYRERYNIEPKYFLVFDELGDKFSYFVLSSTLKQLSNFIGSFFFPFYSDNMGDQILRASESLDIFEDRFTYNDIRKLGLGNLQQECHGICWPE